MTTTLKTCFKCQIVKPLEAFYKHSQMGDGRLNKCKECTKKDVAEHRIKNIQKVREYDRMRASMPHRIAKTNAVTARWRLQYPDRRNAQVALRKAVKDGIVKKLPCFVCGEKAEAHHPDYSAPLDVVWLCPPHHKQTHALMRKAA